MAGTDIQRTRRSFLLVVALAVAVTVAAVLAVQAARRSAPDFDCRAPASAPHGSCPRHDG